MKKEIITIAGDLGSGKSTTSDLVAQELGFERFSSGDLMRSMAKERGVSIGEMNHLAEKELDIDHKIDSTIQRIGEERNKLAIDSRTAWHWIPNSFKVYLSLDPAVAAQRIYASVQAGTRISEEGQSVREVEEKTRSRGESEQKRFIERYSIDPRDTSQFDLVIDTANTPPKKVAQQVVEAYKKWLQS